MSQEEFPDYGVSITRQSQGLPLGIEELKWLFRELAARGKNVEKTQH
jgi:hypothetical protein